MKRFIMLIISMNEKIKHLKFPEKFRRKYIKSCGCDFYPTFSKYGFRNHMKRGTDLPMCFANYMLNETN